MPLPLSLLQTLTVAAFSAHPLCSNLSVLLIRKNINCMMPLINQ